MAEIAPKVLVGTEVTVLGVDRLDYTKGLVHRYTATPSYMSKV